MIGNIKKIGTLLATLALFGSVLLVSIPVNAAGPVYDVYIDLIGVTTPNPTLGDNITFQAEMTVKDASMAALNVSFVASNGTDTLDLETVYVPGPVVKTGPTEVYGYWNTSDIMSFLFIDPAKMYNLTATVTVNASHADANLTNNTLTKVDAIKFKSALMQPTVLAGHATVVQGAPYTLSVTEKNNGNGDLKIWDLFSVYDEPSDDYLVTGMYDGSMTPVAVGASATTTVDINTTDMTIGMHSFNVTSNGVELGKSVEVLANVTNVSVTDISFNPATGLKGTQSVTITASLKNTGPLDWVNKAVTFAIDATPISTCTKTVNVTAGGGTNTTTCVWTIPDSKVAKTYKVNVTADTNMSKNLVAGPSPHWTLQIAGISITPQTLTALMDVGDTQNITIAVTVTNTGDLKAVNATVKLMAGTDVIYSNSTVNISASGQTVVSYIYPIVTKEDDTLVNITANVTLGTSTAQTVKNVTVPGDVDLPAYTISDLTLTPTGTQERGLKTTISVTVKNVGDALGKTITLKFMAGTSQIGTATLTNLTAGGTGNTTSLVWSIPSTFAKGKVDINVTIDGTTVYKNTTYTIIEIKEPVLVIDFAKDSKGKVKGYSSTAASGKTKTLNVVVTLDNKNGTADAKNIHIVIKDSKGNALANSTVASLAAGQTSTVTIAVPLKAGTSTTLTATATYDGSHGIPADTGMTATSPAADSPSAKVVKTPGFEGVILVAAIAVALVVLSRRKKN